MHGNKPWDLVIIIVIFYSNELEKGHLNFSRPTRGYFGNSGIK